MTIGLYWLILLVAICITATVYYSKQPKKYKPTVYNLENHTHIFQPIVINGESFRVVDFDMQGTYVIIIRDRDRQKFKINKM